MAMMTDQQQQNYKHHCRICRKGFGCGRALGGHMRAHGINEDAAAGEQGDADDDPPAGGGGGAAACSPCGSGGGNRRMYALRGSSNRLRTCRVCENCGMEFSSWKGFLEHGRCNYGCDGSLASASAAAAADEEEEEDDDDEEEEEEEEEEEGERRECVGWSKGKRSRRSKTAAGGGGLSSQEEDLASCLVLLSAGRVDPGCAAAVVVETEESCASASKEDRRSSADRTANFLAVEKPKAAVAPPKGMFECKACKKVFSSHQALGGHRASHKKVKGCFAAKLDDLEEAPPEEEPMVAAIAGDGATAVVPFVAAPMRKKKLHECSVCHRVFTSGQALGGHKRCHWLTSNAADQSSSMARLHHMQTQQAKPLLQLRPMNEPLDLNLPAPPEAAAAPLGLDVPALFLQAWMENDNVDPPAAITTNSINKKISASHVEDEAESNVKLAKFSDLKDLNMRGVSTSWLQVGLGSSSKESHKP